MLSRTRDLGLWRRFCRE